MTTPLDLLGTWRLHRDVEDRRDRQRLRVTGSTTLERLDDGRVRWHDEGTLFRPGAEAAPVHRTLHAVPPGHPDEPDGGSTGGTGCTRGTGGTGWWVTFEDGRPFHPWLLGTDVEHPCGEDRYRGRVDVSDPRLAWRVVWDVRGPGKDYTMRTTYSRVR